jgi:hypothetical protein
MGHWQVATVSEAQDTATLYRKHAMQLRIMAAAETEPKQQVLLIQTAGDYERMAEAIEGAGQPEAKPRGHH